MLWVNYMNGLNYVMSLGYDSETCAIILTEL